MRLRLFKRTKTNEYHFQFLSDNDSVLLNSQGYQTKEARTTGINSVIKNSGDPGKYSKQSTNDSKFFFILRAGNNQEIARSPEYDSEGEADKAINECVNGIPKLGEKEDNPYGTDGKDDNYKPLSFYNNRITSLADGFQSFEAEGKFWFTYNSGGGIYIISEGYSSESGRDNGMKSVEKNLIIADRYQYEQHPNGKSYFNLRAGNNQEIATSIWFDSEADMQNAVSGVVGGSSKGSKSNQNIDEYLSCNEYKGHPRKSDNNDFSTFAKDGEFYFAMLDENDAVALRSEGYTTEKARDNGILSVMKNIQIEDRFSIVEDGGKWYICLKAGNHQEIARSCPFGSKGAAESYMEGGGKEEAIPVAAVPAPKKKRKKRAKKPKVAKVEVGSGNYPCSDISYKIFKSGNGKHYFTYRNKDEKAILISSNIRGYETLAEAEAIIAKIAANGSKADHFEERPTKNNKFYYYLKDDDGKNIGKSFFFDTEQEMHSAMKLFDCGLAGGSATAAAAASIGAKSDRRDDDYLVCSAYEGHEVDGDGFSRFENGGEFFFAMHGENGDVKLRSERYSSTSGRDNGIASVKKNRELSERYSIEEARNIFYVILKAGNHQEIARSCPYKSRAAAESFMADPTGAVAALNAAAAAKKAEADAQAKQEADAKAAADARAKRDADAKAIADARAQKEAAAAADLSSKPKAREDDYLKCAAYEGHEVVDGFSRFSQDGEHYFAMHDADGKVSLRSEGYTTQKARENGIDSVRRNRDNEKRWSTEEKMGYHFVILKAGNHQEIGRSCPYQDAAAAAAFISSAPGGFAAAGIAAGLAGGAGSGDAEAEKLAAAAKAKEAAEAAIIVARAKEKADAEAAKQAAAAKAKEEADAAAAKKAAAAAALAAGAAATAGSGGKTEGGAMGSANADAGGSASSSSRSGGIPWWLWLLGLALLALLLFWPGCGLCSSPKDAVTPAVVEQEARVEDNAEAEAEMPVVEEPEVEVEPEPEVTEPTTTLANSPSHRLFNLPAAGTVAKKLPYLGSNPEFGDSHGLSPEQFYNKLKARYDSNPTDRKFLDDAFKAMGYVNGFAAATPAMFSAVELPRGTTGNLGYSAKHRTGYYTLPDAQRHRLAFKIAGANGRDLHFMKTCGNHFYFRA